MPDIVIDYELLHQLGRDTHTFKERLDDARNTRIDYAQGELDWQVEMAIQGYYNRWKGAFKNAGDLLEKLSKTYTSVAQQWFDQDGRYAAQASEQTAGFIHSEWESKKAAHDNWEKLSHTYVPVHGYDDNGNPYEMQVPLADPNAPPQAPGNEPVSYEYTSPDGSQHHTTTTTYNSDGTVEAQDTTVTDGDGLSYHEHTVFGANNSHTSTVDHPDGSSTVDTVTGNADGSGTRTTTTTDADGKATTSTYTGTGLGTENESWTENKTQNGGGGGGGGGGKNDSFNHGHQV